MNETFEQLATRSASWNGYEREAAIKALSNLKDPRAIPLFIHRSNDWVKSIKDLSHDALLEFLAHNPEAVVSYLPQIFRLRQKRRWDHAALIDSVVKNLVEIAPRQLFTAITSTDNKLAMIAFNICVEYGLAPTEELFGASVSNRYLHSSNQMRALAEKLDASYIDAHADKLLTIRYAPLKTKIIRRLDLINPEKVSSIADTLICHKDAAIRLLGRKHLKLSETDTIHYYLTFLDKSSGNLNHKVVAVTELAAMQKMEALPTLKNLLKDKEPKMRKCTLNQLALLLGEQAKSILTEALTDTQGNVSRESARLCYKLGIVFSQEEILSLAAITDRGRTMDNLLLISKLQDRWIRLTLYLKLLKLYEYEDVTLHRLQHAIDRWWVAAYQGTGHIPRAQKEEIRTLLLAGKRTLKIYQFEQLKFMLETDY